MEGWRRPPGDPASNPEEALARQFVAGNEHAVAHVQAMIARVVRFRGYYIPTQDQGDVIQEVMLQLCQAFSRPGFSFTRNMDAFVRSVAHRRCVDWMRQRRVTEELPEVMADAAVRPDGAFLERERSDLALRVLQEMAEPCRDLIRLHAGESMTYPQIARLQGRSEGALRVQMYECLREARRILGRIHREQRRGAGEERSSR